MATEPREISNLTPEQRLASKVALLGYRELVVDIEFDFEEELVVSQIIRQTDGLNIIPEYQEANVFKLTNLTSDQFGKLFVQASFKIDKQFTFSVYPDFDNYNGYLISVNNVVGQYPNIVKFTLILRIYE